ncbi:MAG TPA: hypothetical protein VFQ88_10690 [Nevskiaceae bacterium]|nr:hypothetical protein [Nevskiaceae bacterium]
MIELLGGEQRRNASQALPVRDVRDKRILEASGLQRTWTLSRSGDQRPRLGKRQIDACIDTLLDACVVLMRSELAPRVRAP